jgi:hypothetical protein
MNSFALFHSALHSRAAEALILLSRAEPQMILTSAEFLSILNIEQGIKFDCVARAVRPRRGVAKCLI